MTSTPKDSKFERAHTRKVLRTGVSAKGFAVPDETLCGKWGPFLDSHLRSVRPGRATALLDVKWMLDTHNVRITSGAIGDAASSTDEPRRLSEAEVRVIGEWLEMHRAETPAGATELRATEVFFMPRRLQWSRRSPP